MKSKQLLRYMERMPSSRQPRQSWRRLGPLTVWVLTTSTILLILVIAFLCFLWVGFNAKATSGAASTWRSIITNNWASRSITLSTFVLRWTVGTQAAIATSMWAAYMLERTGVRLRGTAAISLLRNNNSGPHQLIYHLGTVESLTHLRKGALIVAVLLVTTILSQLASTALLSDLGDGALISQSPNSSIYMWWNARDPNLRFHAANGVKFWNSRPAHYPLFAEPEGASVNIQEPGVDIASTFRALLPIREASDRTRLLKYSGMGTTTQWNISCGPLDGTPAVFIEEGGSQSPRIQYAEINDGQSEVRAFNCTIPQRESGGSNHPGEWVVVFCLDTLTFYDEQLNTVEYNFSAVVINTTANGLRNSTVPSTDQLELSSSLTDGIWSQLEYTASSMSRPLAFGLTVCEMSLNITNQHIEVSSNLPYDEPELEWDALTGRYSSHRIRRQLGIPSEAHLSLSERGVMELTNLVFEPGSGYFSNNISYDVSEYSLDELIFSIDLLQSTTVVMCYHDCMPISGDTLWPAIEPHRAQIALFQDILTTTRSPAQALLTHYSTLLQMAYYDGIIEFDRPANATTTFSRLFTMPIRWNGFSAVMTVVAVHILCMLFSTWVFLSGTKLSLLGNAWQAVSQVALGDAKDLVAGSTMRSDDEVLKADSTGLTADHTPIMLRMSEDDTMAVLAFRRPRSSSEE